MLGRMKGKVLPLVGLALVLLALVGIYDRFYRLKDCLVSMRGHIGAMQGMANPQSGSLDPEVMRTELKGMRSDLQTLKAEVAPLLSLCPYLGWVPAVGEDIRAAPYLLDIGLDLLAAGESAFEGLAPALSLASKRGSVSAQDLIAEALPLLDQAGPQLLEAQAALKRAAQTRQEIEAEALSPLSGRWVARLDKYLPLAQAAIQGGRAAPELLGASEPKNYLILAQNEDERRPVGGYITGAGLVTVDKGRIVQVEFKDSYAVDDFSRPYPDPPPPLFDYMGAEIWVFRDSNWSPHFPASARAASDLYQWGQGVAVDGVVSLDQEAVRLLVGALGPLQLEGFEGEVTGDNVLEKMRGAWSPSEEQLATGDWGTNPEVFDDWWKDRKAFMTTLSTAILSRLETDLGSVEVLKLVEAMRQGLEEKHILIYMRDPLTSSILADNNWDGAIRSAPGDYLMVIDANMGFNKASVKVEEAINYQVTIDEHGRASGKVTLHYHHTSTKELDRCVQEIKYGETYEEHMDRCYWDYVRLYAPGGSRFLSANYTPVPAHSLLSGKATSGAPIVGPRQRGKEVFANFFVLPTGEERQLRFEYRLPGRVVRRGPEGHHYSLLLQKQPGTIALPVHVEVTLPSWAQMVSSEPEPIEVNGGVVKYRLALSTDQSIELLFRPVEELAPTPVVKWVLPAEKPTEKPAPAPTPTPIPTSRPQATPTVAPTVPPKPRENVVKNPSFESFAGTEDDGQTDTFAEWHMLAGQRQAEGLIEAMPGGGDRSPTALKLTMTGAPGEGYWLGLQQLSGQSAGGERWELAAQVFAPQGPLSCTLDIRAMMVQPSSSVPVQTSAILQYHGGAEDWLPLKTDLIAPAKFGRYDVMVQVGLVSTVPFSGQQQTFYVDNLVLRRKTGGE